MKKIVTLTLNPAVDKSSRVKKVAANVKLRCAPPQYEPGGGGLNVSRAIKKLGGHSSAWYLAGGRCGEFLSELLEKEALLHHKVKTAKVTRENLTIYDESNGDQFRFGMPGPKIARAEWQSFFKLIEKEEKQADYLIASGSIKFEDSEQEFFEQLLDLSQKMGSKLVVDTSGSSLKIAVEQGAYLIKPNIRELQEIAGRKFEDGKGLENSAKELIERGKLEVIVLSLGAGGALLVTKSGSERINSPTVPISSRVGAGDSMLGGLIFRLAQGATESDAVKFGVAAGAAAVMTPGSELCRKEDTERLYQDIIAGNL